MPDETPDELLNAIGCGECADSQPAYDQPWLTSFVREHKRSPTAKLDGIAAWLRNEIEYLESISRTEFGDGSLSSYKGALREIERG